MASSECSEAAGSWRTLCCSRGHLSQEESTEARGQPHERIRTRESNQALMVHQTASLEFISSPDRHLLTPSRNQNLFQASGFPSGPGTLRSARGPFRGFVRSHEMPFALLSSLTHAQRRFPEAAQCGHPADGNHADAALTPETSLLSHGTSLHGSCSCVLFTLRCNEFGIAIFQ